MKKLPVLAIFGMVSCVTSFGQGFFIFNSSAGARIYENITTPGNTVVSAGTVRVGFLWTEGAAQTIPGLTGPTGTNFTGADWDLLNAPGWKWATNSTSGGLLAGNTRSIVPTTGTFGFGNIGIIGTSPGQTISLYVIGWSSLYSNPFLAVLEDSPLGWSNPIDTVLGVEVIPGGPFVAEGLQSFVVNLIPEPTLFTLFGLGAAVMIVRQLKR